MILIKTYTFLGSLRSRPCFCEVPAQDQSASSHPDKPWPSVVNISSITISAQQPPGSFSETNTCPAKLGAGQSCLIWVTWKNKSLSYEYFHGVLTISDDGLGSPQKVDLRAGWGCPLI